MISISYCITVKDELEEITRLVNHLHPLIYEDDDIVIQYDEGGVTEEVLDYLKVIEKMHDDITVIGYPLDNDFGKFKSNLKEYSQGDYIMQLDADEIPNSTMVRSLSAVLENNNVDLFFVPRINTVDGLTEEHIKKWGWKVNGDGYVNFPDYQGRLYRNTDDVNWHGKVHETITGYDTFSNFPAEEDWCLYHHKTIEKQEKQNSFYNTL